MDFPPLPPPFRLDTATVHLLVTLTFVIQSVVIGFHAPLSRHFAGIRTFLTSVLLLAAGALILVAQSWLPRGPVGLLSTALILWGASLQYLALARFLGRPVHGWLVWGWPGLMSLVLLVSGVLPIPPPWMALRELLPVPFLLAAAVVILRSDTTGFRTGAILTALPFAGYAIRSLTRLVMGSVDPSLQGPGPSQTHAYDALAFFVFSLLWTSGFLLMVNQRLQHGLETLATEDPLTGCLNRRAMGCRLEEEWHRYQRYGQPFTVILLDLDRFKAINDTRGHDVGDGVLVKTAQALKQTLRAEDTLARWGGEEFLILLPATEVGQGILLGERLRRQLEVLEFEVPGLVVTLSGGVAGAEPGQTVPDVCRRADAALYEAKKTRNRIVRAS